MIETKKINLTGTMRLPFLALAPTYGFFGLSIAVWNQGQLDIVHAILVIIGIFAAQISVNVLNEYYDFKSGLDLKTERTPFSGGSGTLPQKPELARSTLILGLAAFAITGVIGIFFAISRGLLLLPLGLLGMVMIYTYTIWVNRFPIPCLVAPGLGFGVLIVVGTDFVLTGQYSWTALIASLTTFFLASNLLLLNQFPDVDADRSVGRRHLPIVTGKQKSALVYIAFLALAYMPIIVGVLTRYLPVPSLLGLGTIILAVPTAVGVYRHATDTQKLIPFMGMNVALMLGTPVLMGVGFLIG